MYATIRLCIIALRVVDLQSTKRERTCLRHEKTRSRFIDINQTTILPKKAPLHVIMYDNTPL